MKNVFHDYICAYKRAGAYTVNLIKWTFLATIIGIASSIVGVVFHHATDYAAHIRQEYPFVLYFLPIAGAIIVFIYRICKLDNDKGTNAIIQSVRTSEKISVLVTPLIVISTALTHLCGGSSGREGAALQIGGSMGSFISRGLRLKNYNYSVAVMCGMSAVFSAVFGTPLTAAVFSLEVVSVGIMHYSALLPALISALSANCVAVLMGVHKTKLTVMCIPQFNILILLKVITLSILCAILSVFFIWIMHSASNVSSKFIENKYIRIMTGAVIVVILTLFVGDFTYNGPGMNIVEKAVNTGSALPYDFLLKIFFTMVTLSVGFKGGEIVPTFFIGATFGVFASGFLGLNPSFAASIGLVALFCGVVNCPIAALLLSVELFGIEGVYYYALASAIGYFLSGHCSLYTSQKIVFSKLHDVIVDVDFNKEKNI